MVIVQKTYSRVRGTLNKIATLMMVAVGFILLVIMPSRHGHDTFLGDAHLGGVAHADGGPCFSCDEGDASFESTSAGECGEGCY